MKFFFYRWLHFSFDIFLSTFNTCTQLRNVNEIFQSSVMEVFQKKKFLPDNTFHESKIKSLLKIT